MLDIDRDLFDITIFNAEPRVNYNRLMLSPVLSGDKTYEDIITHDDTWYTDNSITLYKSTKIVKIDVDEKLITTDKQEIYQYDKLVICNRIKPHNHTAARKTFAWGDGLP